MAAEKLLRQQESNFSPDSGCVAEVGRSLGDGGVYPGSKNWSAIVLWCGGGSSGSWLEIFLATSFCYFLHHCDF